MSDKNIDNYTIRLSRLPLFLLFLMGAFFFSAGLEIGFLHKLIPSFKPDSDKMTLFYITIGIFIILGGVVAFQMLWYLVIPPITLRADSRGISFGTGLRYTLYTVPWKYIDTIGPGIDLINMVATKQFSAGFQILVKNDPQIPSMKGTSMGIFYFNYTLTLNWFYMNEKNLSHVKESIEKIRGNNRV